MHLSFQKLFYVVASIFALFAILILAKSILIPLSFALLLSFILIPVANKLEHWKIGRILAAFLSIFLVLLIIGVVIYLFSTQLVTFSDQFSHFQHKLIDTFAHLTTYINNNISIIPNLDKEEIFHQIKDWLNKSTGNLIQQTFANTASFFAGSIAVIIFTFLFLIYRDALLHTIIGFFPTERKPRITKMLFSIRQIGQKYLFGLLIVIVIIGLANSLGLLIMGIGSAFFFGYLSATMSIVPYVGTTLGSLIAVLYTFVAYENPWLALGVAVLFWAVQFVADNYLTPKIVGSSLKMNAMATILSLIIGAYVWGVAGIILFFPFTAMLKVFCEEFAELKPFSLILSDRIHVDQRAKNHWLHNLLHRNKK